MTTAPQPATASKGPDDWATRLVEALLRAVPGVPSVVLVLTLIFYIAAVMATKRDCPEFCALTW